MSDPSASQHDYNAQQDASYQTFEGGSGSLTDQVAYRILGDIAFKSVNPFFSNEPILRVCDVGSYLGGSSAHWLASGQSNLARYTRVQVLGTDIYESNIRRASEKYQHFTDLQFQFMSPGGEIPCIEERPYHLIFAAFVLDTIASFDNVSILCRRMVEALEPQGEIYMLRLHPNALMSRRLFCDYFVDPRPVWQHGDPLNIQLTTRGGKSIKINDTYWEPSRICDVFASVGCQATLLDVSLHGSPSMQQHLEYGIANVSLASDMSEWHVPLYQIIQVKKR